MDELPCVSELSDKDLLARIQGDERAFAELVRRHGRYLFGVARSMIRDDHEAEDVVQETFAALLKSHFRGESAVRTWLVAITVRQASMNRRKRKRWVVGRTDESSIDRAVEPATTTSDAKMDLPSLLAVLTPELREVIVLRELQQMSYDEIARTLQIPQGTVESRLHRARNELKRHFADRATSQRSG